MLDNIFQVNDEKFAVGELSPDEWAVKLDYRSKDRMKVTFKLNQDETQAFTNFKNQTKPEEVSEDMFVKSIFFLGLSTLEANISQRISQELKSQDEDVSIPEDEEASAPEDEPTNEE